MITGGGRAVLPRYDVDSTDHRDPELIGRLIDLLEPALWTWFTPEVKGVERIPEGACLYVGNHNSAMLSPDTFIFGCAAWRVHGADAIPYGLTHETALKLPVFHQILMRLGSVRACPDNAARVFADGGKVLVYPGGEMEALRPTYLSDRVVFGERRGYIRLALREGVPLVPIVAAGAHETLYIFNDGRWLAELLRLDKVLRLSSAPVAFSVPWGLTIGPPPPHFPLRTRIHIEVLEPIALDGAGEPGAADDVEHVERCHARVVGLMQAALDRLVVEREAAKAAAG